MTELDTFRAAVERFIETHDLAPSAFGRDFAADVNFVFDLREKDREPRSRTRKRVTDLMEQAAQGRWPARGKPADLAAHEVAA